MILAGIVGDLTGKRANQRQGRAGLGRAAHCGRANAGATRWAPRKHQAGRRKSRPHDKRLKPFSWRTASRNRAKVRSGGMACSGCHWTPTMSRQERVPSAYPSRALLAGGGSEWTLRRNSRRGETNALRFHPPSGGRAHCRGSWSQSPRALGRDHLANALLHLGSAAVPLGRGARRMVRLPDVNACDLADVSIHEPVQRQQSCNACEDRLLASRRSRVRPA